ncbi:hypothetical protein SNE40_004785 [Patella caerulea]|uniref:TTF-type domain-containing protein n=1 Tax=Patella caerulea TaxID=87958 RepID=A0AAN8K9J4_PATCE
MAVKIKMMKRVNVDDEGGHADGDWVEKQNADGLQKQKAMNTVTEMVNNPYISSAPNDLAASLNPVQPKSVPGGFPVTDGRRFNPSWYVRYPWLEYSIERHAAFCHPCRIYGKEYGKGGLENKRFTTLGFSKWKNATDKKKGFCKHEESGHHVTAVTDMKSREMRSAQNSSVSVQINQDVFERRRYYVKSIAEMIQWLTTNGLALRGDYVYNNDSGLFNSLFEYTLLKDSRLREIGATIPKNASYKSPEIQNDIIDIMASMVSKDVANDVNSSDANLFTLFCDGTRDKTNFENFSIGVRYVKEGKAYESLLHMPKTDELGAAGLCRLDELAHFGLDPARMLSQCYDGCSTMSGDKGGLQD